MQISQIDMVKCCYAINVNKAVDYVSVNNIMMQHIVSVTLQVRFCLLIILIQKTVSVSKIHTTILYKTCSARQAMILHTSNEPIGWFGLF